ncbi:MAG: hypothetical protein D6813_01725, partial [Calditrichaeota bacterium]
IKRKKGSSSELIKIAKAYFYHKRNLIGFLAVFFIFLINYFNISPFIKLNLAALSIGVLALFFYLTALYQKRFREGNLITIKNSN